MLQRKAASKESKKSAMVELWSASLTCTQLCCKRAVNVCNKPHLQGTENRTTAMKRAIMQDVSALKRNLKLCLDSRYRFAPSTATLAAL